MGLERGPLSLVRSIEELLELKSSGSGLENRDLTAAGIRCADHVTPLYLQKLALTSPTGGGRSVGIVRSRTKATEFFFFLIQIRHVQEAPESNVGSSPERWTKSGLN